MGRVIAILKEQPATVAEFDSSLWSALADKLVVKSKDDVTVIFNDGTAIKI